jgi:putative hemolysin
MTGMYWELGIVLFLILVNGLLAMSELAMVSARKARLRQAAEAGNRGARAALELTEDPNRFLSTVQIGITFVGTLAGVYGGATFAEHFAEWLRSFPALTPYAESLALGFVVALITFLSLVLGELVPKRLALGNPEGVATRVAGPLKALSIITVPLVKLLSGSTNLVLRIFRVRPSEVPPVTAEEIQVLMREGAQAGVFQETEHDIVTRAFRLNDYPARVLMTPRADMVWIDVADPPEAVKHTIVNSPHSRFPVCEGELDKVLGIVHVKDLLIHGFVGQPFDVRGILKMPLFVFEGMSGLKVLEQFKSSPIHLAIVLDEYGSVEGLVTLNDLLEAIIGDLASEEDGGPERAVKREDGSWLLDGTLTTAELHDLIPLPEFPEGDFHTLAGFILLELGRIPAVGDHLAWGGYRFEVVDMDDNRIDRVLVSTAEKSEPAA